MDAFILLFFLFFIASHGAGKCVLEFVFFIFISFFFVAQFIESYLLRHLSISPIAIPIRFLHSSFLFFASPLPTLHLLPTYLTFTLWTLNLWFSTFLQSFPFVYITSFFCFYLPVHPFTSFNARTYSFIVLFSPHFIFEYILFIH